LLQQENSLQHPENSLQQQETFFAAAREHFAVASDFLRLLVFKIIFFRSSKRMIFSFLMVFFL
jgi:hypothetical protein